MSNKRAAGSGKGRRAKLGSNASRAVTSTVMGRRDQLLLEAVHAFQAMRLREAEDLGLKILTISPGYPPALQMLGMIAGRTGRTALGIDLLRKVVRIEPQAVDARVELAELLRKDGNAEEAIAQYQEAIRLRPDDAGAYNVLGLTYLADRRLPDAVVCFERGIAIRPDVAILHHNLGMTLQLQGRPRDAETSFQRAIVLAPGLADAHARLGHLKMVQGESEQAFACFRRAIETQTSSVDGRVQLARVLMDVGQVGAAEDCLRVAITSEPNAADAHEELGNVLRQLGRFDEAVGCFERAIALQPLRTSAHLGIALSARFTPADRPLIERMEALLQDSRLEDRDRANLHYALGKARDELAEYELAMRHFEVANLIAFARLMISGRAIDRRRHADTIERLIATFTSEFLTRHAALGMNTELPILIVGMIRSGTTLVEQILSSHPKVGAGGELHYWGDRGVEVKGAASGNLDSVAANKLAGDYLRLLRAAAPGAERITDKMPTNFLLLGLIHMVLPGARIIHCRRNPLDNCLSLYFTPYPRSPDYAHDPGNIVFYYEQYARLMAHWLRVLPTDRILEVDYEELVADPERVTRQMIAFCGLDWDDSCLQHERNARAIRTPSQWQARQPMYQTSVARWRNYEPWLGEFRRLFRSLQPKERSEDHRR